MGADLGLHYVLCLIVPFRVTLVKYMYLDHDDGKMLILFIRKGDTRKFPMVAGSWQTT